jgi:hypothetical protein
MLQFQRQRLSLAGGFTSTITENSYGYFTKISANGTPLAVAGLFSPLSLSNGSCIEYTTIVDVSLLNSGGGASQLLMPSGGLDAGPNIALSGPGGSMNLSGSNGGYSAQLASAGVVSVPGAPSFTTGQTFLANGNWSFQAPGGRDIKAFTASAPLNSLFTVADADRFQSFTKGQPVTFRWSGAGSSSDSVTLQGIAYGNLLSSTATVGVFECRAPADANSFTVPGNITGQLPSDASGSDVFILSNSSVGTFTAPLVAGGSLDSGVVVANFMDLWQAGVK